MWSFELFIIIYHFYFKYSFCWQVLLTCILPNPRDIKQAMTAIITTKNKAGPIVNLSWRVIHKKCLKKNEVLRFMSASFDFIWFLCIHRRYNLVSLFNKVYFTMYNPKIFPLELRYMSKYLNSNKICVIRCLNHYPTPLPCYTINSILPHSFIHPQ